MADPTDQTRALAEARQLGAHYSGEIYADDEPSWDGFMLKVATALTAARAEGFAQAREMAAEVAVDCRLIVPGTATRGETVGLVQQQIATAIRAMVQP